MFNAFIEALNELEELSRGSSLIDIVYLGKCQDGYELPSFIVKGKSTECIIIIGMPHGNEPIGFWICVDFIKKIIQAPYPPEHCYFIVPILDYDVGVKNIWIRRKFDLQRFMNYNYLNTVADQIEFTYGQNKMAQQLSGLIRQAGFLKAKCAVFIHQTPTISGGYFYTNITGKRCHKSIQQAFALHGIPPEPFPQGKNVERKDVGIFGVFKRCSIPIKFSEHGYSCQEYFDSVFNMKFLTVEIPFFYTGFYLSSQPVKLKYCDQILIFFKQCESLRDKITAHLKCDFAQESLYWLNSSIEANNIIQKILQRGTDTVAAIDLCQIIKHLFYKLSYIAMAKRIANDKISAGAKTIQNDGLLILEQYKQILGLTLVDNDVGFSIFTKCLEALRGNLL